MDKFDNIKNFFSSKVSKKLPYKVEEGICVHVSDQWLVARLFKETNNERPIQ